MNLKPRRHEEPEINLVSLIDVVLMLVVFFMLSSQFVTEGRVRIVLPQALGAPGVKQQAEPLVVSVTQAGGYRVNEKDLINSSPDTLRAALVKVAGQERNQRLTVRADGRATHQSVITALDVIGRLGFKEINIATIKDETPAAGKP
ncbi:MAG TPA: biopolymer transporter ExbD [Steroidobacteraceae bacterium]|nr:biopolymer transporter ExbD [Steroidobacteraceae bacterium]